MTVLITGGGGMIGSFTARELRAQGQPVALYDLAFRPEALVGLEDVPRREGDVTHQEQVFAAVRDLGARQIIHTAAVLTPVAVTDPYRAASVNIQGILNALEATRQLGLGRLVFASSGRVYGQARGVAGPVGEDSPFDPESAYGTTKIASEFLGKNYVDAFGIQFVALRFSSVFGPGAEYGRSGFRALRPLLEGPLNGRPPDPRPLFAGATEMVYVRDVARAVARAARAETLAYRAYNIGSGYACSSADLRRTILRIVGQPDDAPADLDQTADLARQEPVRLLDTTRARTDLGYVAEFDLERALRDHLDWLRRLGYQDAWLLAHPTP